MVSAIIEPVANRVLVLRVKVLQAIKESERCWIDFLERSACIYYN